MPKDRRILILAIAAALTVLIGAYVILAQPHTLEVTVLDVGEGLDVVMRTPSGKTIVMDCGTAGRRDAESIGEKITAPYLQSLGVDTIDVAVLSHPHADHISGYAGLLHAKPAKLVLDIGAPYRSPSYRAFLKTVKKSRATYRIARRGQSLDMGDGVSVEVINPDPGKAYSNLNDRSISLRVVFGSVAFMLCADAGDEAEGFMLESGTTLESQVLLVGHHGSSHGTGSPWLAAVRPQVAVISCGRGNQYGHPSREVIARLRALGIRTYRTDRNGAVQFITDGKNVRARTFGQSR